MSEQYCTFYLEGRMFGVEVRQVQEVLKYQDTTEVPLAPRIIGGLLNLRGNIVSSVDMRLRLGLPPLPTGELPSNVVIQTSTGLASLLVDRIGDVVEVTGDEFEPPPDTLDEESRQAISGVYKLPTCLMLILDVERVLQFEPAHS